jgi:hypothetical protein
VERGDRGTGQRVHELPSTAALDEGQRSRGVAAVRDLETHHVLEQWQRQFEEGHLEGRVAQGDPSSLHGLDAGRQLPLRGVVQATPALRPRKQELQRRNPCGRRRPEIGDGLLQGKGRLLGLLEESDLTFNRPGFGLLPFHKRLVADAVDPASRLRQVRGGQAVGADGVVDAGPADQCVVDRDRS